MSADIQYLTASPDYRNLLERISDTYTQGSTWAVLAVNAHITETYGQVGRHIIEFEQGEKSRADYGTALLVGLSRDLTLRHGRGFSRSKLTCMRLFYLRYPIGEKPSHILSWSIPELMRQQGQSRHSATDHAMERHRAARRPVARTPCLSGVQS